MNDASKADEIAKASAAAMWAEDNASRSLGMALERVSAGEAVMSLEVTERMVNGHGLCHGGYIFLLADSAFAFACNSHNQRNVAFNCQVTFLAPARLGMKLTAVAHERHRVERTGITDVTVTADSGEKIAEFRGISRAIPGKLVPDLT